MTRLHGTPPLRVVLIYRKATAGGHSIEEIFHTVADELSPKLEIIEYQVGGRHRQLWDAWALRRLKADIYHVTGDIHYFVLLLPWKRTVVTIHDINHFLHGLKGMRQWLYKRIWLTLPIRRAAAVTSVSTATRSNIASHLGVAANRVQVVENCHRPAFKPSARPFAADCPVILQVGTYRHKNVLRLADALKGMKCHLVLVGRLDAETTKRLAENGIAYESHVGLSSEELYRRYVECDAVSFVSTREGFGMPIIEAQSVGRPVITANMPPMRDVAGKGACLVNPLDVKAIRDGIRRILDDPAYRDRLVEDGFENVGRFSPAAISAQYEALYNRILAASAGA